MTRLVILVLFLQLPGLRTAAQNLPRHAVHLDPAAALQHTLRVGYACQVSPHTGIEIEVSFRQFQSKPNDLFNGEQYIEYIQERVDSFITWSNQRLNHPEWRYLGKNRPMEPLSERIDLYTAAANLRLLLQYPFAGGRWCGSLQPGFFMGIHQSYTVEDVHLLQHETSSLIPIAWPGGDAVSLRHVAAYKQTRYMEEQNTLIYGLSYGGGLQRRFGKRFFIELRASMSLNLNPPYSPGPSGQAGRFSGLYGVKVGYGFDARKAAENLTPPIR